MTERSRARTKSQENTAKIQQCVLDIFNSHHQHSKTRPEMSPLQIAATSALLLACVYLSVGTPIPVTPRTGTEDVDDAITKRTGTEAIHAKKAVDDYLKDVYGNKDLNVKANCSSLLHHIVLPCPQNVPGCNSMVSVSKNLNYLLYMYSHVLGFIYQSNTYDAQMVKLDYLEMIYHRFYNQMQRYLQACNLSHGDTMCSEHEDIDEKIIALQVEFPDMKEVAKVILCHLRSIAFCTMRKFGEKNSPLRPYKFCRISPVLNETCQTH